MEFDESMSLSQELYEEFSYRIPNWEGKFRLVEIPLSLVCEDNAVLRFHDTFNPQRCIDEVSQVIATFDSFLDLIIDRGGRLGDEELEHVLAAGLVRLCRAYHSSQCELSEDQLGEDVLAKVETSVPTWGWSAFSSLEPAYGPQ